VGDGYGDMGHIEGKELCTSRTASSEGENLRGEGLGGATEHVWHVGGVHEERKKRKGKRDKKNITQEISKRRVIRVGSYSIKKKKHN